MVAAPGWGSPRETVWANIRCRCLELLSTGALSRSYLAGGRDVFGAYLRGGSVCVCPVFLCLWLSREPRGGLKTESLAFSCCHFSVSPFAFCCLSQGLGTGLSVPVCPAFHMLPAPNGLARLGTGVTPARCAGARGKPPARAVRWIRQAHPARPGSVSRRRAHFGPGPSASPLSRVLFPPPPPLFRDLGLEIGKQARKS